MEPARDRRRISLRLVPVVVLAVFGAVLLAVSVQDADDQAAAKASASPSSSKDPADPARSEDPGLARRADGDPLARGRADAPVVIVEYADFRCPFCAKFSRETMPGLMKKYVDTGLVRYEFRDLPLFGEESMQAAIAGRAAGRQGRFWQFLDAAYGAAPEHGHPPMPRATLIAYAKKAGVPDLARFERDLADKGLRAAVQKDAAEAQQLGVTSVPMFAIDNVAVSGAQPASVFEQVIGDRLKAHNVDGVK